MQKMLDLAIHEFGIVDIRIMPRTRDPHEGNALALVPLLVEWMHVTRLVALAAEQKGWTIYVNDLHASIASASMRYPWAASSQYSRLSYRFIIARICARPCEVSAVPKDPQRLSNRQGIDRYMPFVWRSATISHFG